MTDEIDFLLLECTHMPDDDKYLLFLASDAMENISMPLLASSSAIAGKSIMTNIACKTVKTNNFLHDIIKNIGNIGNILGKYTF